VNAKQFSRPAGVFPLVADFDQPGGQGKRPIAGPPQCPRASRYQRSPALVLNCQFPPKSPARQQPDCAATQGAHFAANLGPSLSFLQFCELVATRSDFKFHGAILRPVMRMSGLGIGKCFAEILVSPCLYNIRARRWRGAPRAASAARLLFSPNLLQPLFCLPLGNRKAESRPDNVSRDWGDNKASAQPGGACGNRNEALPQSLPAAVSR